MSDPTCGWSVGAEPHWPHEVPPHRDPTPTLSPNCPPCSSASNPGVSNRRPRMAVHAARHKTGPSLKTV